MNDEENKGDKKDIVTELRDRAKRFATLGYLSLSLTGVLFILAIVIYLTAYTAAGNVTSDQFQVRLEQIQDSTRRVIENYQDSINRILRINSDSLSSVVRSRESIIRSINHNYDSLDQIFKSQAADNGFTIGLQQNTIASIRRDNNFLKNKLLLIDNTSERLDEFIDDFHSDFYNYLTAANYLCNVLEEELWLEYQRNDTIKFMGDTWYNSSLLSDSLQVLFVRLDFYRIETNIKMNQLDSLIKM